MANKRESVGAEGIYSVKWQCRRVRGGPVLTGGPRIVGRPRCWSTVVNAGGSITLASNISGKRSPSLEGAGALGSQQSPWSALSSDEWCFAGVAIVPPWQPCSSTAGPSWCLSAGEGKQNAWQSAGTSASASTSARPSGAPSFFWCLRALMRRSERDWNGGVKSRSRDGA